MRRDIETIDVWPETYGGEFRGYAISECDDDGEIRCIGGGKNRRNVWRDACRRARELGVNARWMDERNRVCDTYTPPKAAVVRAEKSSWVGA